MTTYSNDKMMVNHQQQTKMSDTYICIKDPFSKGHWWNIEYSSKNELLKQALSLDLKEKGRDFYSSMKFSPNIGFVLIPKRGMKTHIFPIRDDEILSETGFSIREAKTYNINLILKKERPASKRRVIPKRPVLNLPRDEYNRTHLMGLGIPVPASGKNKPIIYWLRKHQVPTWRKTPRNPITGDHFRFKDIVKSNPDWKTNWHYILCHVRNNVSMSAEMKIPITIITKEIRSALKEYFPKNSVSYFVLSTSLAKALVSLNSIIHLKGTARAIAIAGIIIDIVQFIVGLLLLGDNHFNDIPNLEAKIHPIIESAIPSLFSKLKKIEAKGEARQYNDDKTLSDIQLAQQFGIDNNDKALKLLIQTSNPLVADTLIQVYNRQAAFPYMQTSILPTVHYSKTLQTTTIASTVAMPLETTEIVDPVPSIVFEPKQNREYTDEEKDLMPSSLHLDCIMPEPSLTHNDGTVKCSDGVVTGMCFFLANEFIPLEYFKYKRSTHLMFNRGSNKPQIGSSSELKKYIKDNYDYDIQFTESENVNGKRFDFHGVNIDEAKSILQKLGLQATIWSVEYDKHFIRHDEHAVREDIGDDPEYQLIFLVNSPCGNHWTIPKDMDIDDDGMIAEGILEGLDEKWITILSWILGLGGACIIGKALDWVGMEHRVSSAMTNLGKLKGCMKSCDEIGNWLRKNVCGTKSAAELHDEKLLELESQANELMKIPAYDYFLKPWKLAEYSSLIKTMKDSLTTVSSSNNTEVVNMCRSTLLALQKNNSDLIQSMVSQAPRKVPVAVYIYGKEGVGKSEACNWFASKLRAAYDYPSDCIYSSKGSVRFFVPYQQQPIGIFDEAFDRIDSEDKFMNDIKSIISSEFYNMEGAAISSKVAPCNFEFVIITTNTAPNELHSMLPFTKDGIDAVFSRLIILEARYNQGEAEEKKPRNIRKRLDDCGHIDFHLVSYHPMIKDQFAVSKTAWTGLDVLNKMKKEKEISVDNHKRQLCLMKAEGDSINHCVINLNGPPGIGKSECISRILDYFSQYQMPICTLSYPDIPILTKPHLVVCDDQILEERGSVDPEREKWYMQCFNTIPGPSLFVLATNIICPTKSRELLNGTKGLLAVFNKKNRVPTIVKRRKHPFSNVGMVRRMGYSGHFKIQGALALQPGQDEYNVQPEGFFNVSSGACYSINDMPGRVWEAYSRFLELHTKSAVIEGKNPGPLVPSVEIVGNKTIVTNIKSEMKVFSMISNDSGDSDGNRITIKQEVYEKLTGLKNSALIPKFELEYTREGSIAIVQHFLNLLLPQYPDLVLYVNMEGLDTIITKGRLIYILNSNHECAGITEKLDVVNHTITLEYDGETVKIPYISFYMAWRDKRVYEEFNNLPIALVRYMNNWCTEIHRRAPAAWSHVKEEVKQDVRLSLKKALLARAAKTWNFVKENPILSGFVLVVVSLLGLGVLFKTLSSSEKSNKIRREDLHRVLRLIHSAEAAALLHDDNILSNEIDAIESMDRNQFYAALESLQEAETRKGKNKGRLPGSRGHFKSRSRRFRLPDGTIAYSSDGVHIDGIYHPLRDVYRETNGQERLPETSQELTWRDELQSFAESMKAELPAQAQALPNQNIVLPKMKASSGKIEKVCSNLVYVAYAPKGETCPDIYPLGTANITPALCGLMLRDNIVLIPKHVLIMANGGDMFIRDSRTDRMDASMNNTNVWYKIKKIWISKDTDEGLFRVVSPIFPRAPSILHLIDADNIPQHSFPVCFVDPRNGSNSYFHGSCLAMFTPKKIAISTSDYTVIDAGVVTFGHAKIRPTSEGSCGLPYFKTNNVDKPLIGYHIASQAFNDVIPVTTVQFFSKPMIEIVTNTPVAESMASELPIYYMDDQQGDLLIGAANRFRRNPDSALLPDPQPTDRVAILGVTNVNHDNEKEGDIIPTPYSELIEEYIPKLTTPAVLDPDLLTPEERAKLPLDRTGRPSSTVLQEMMWSDFLPYGESDEFMKAVRFELQPYFNERHPWYRPLTDHETLNGVKESGAVLKPLEVDTSVGYMLKVTHGIKKKKELINVDPQTGRRSWARHPATKYVLETLLDYELHCKRGEIPMMLYKNCRKYEKLGLEKRWKSRIFTVADIRQVLLERKYLGMFNAQSCLDINSHNAVGITPADFDFLANQIKAYGQGFTGDYSRYDKHVHPRIAAVTREIKATIAEMHCGKEIGNAVRALCSAVHQSMHVTMNTIYRKNSGLNSGAFSTEEDNSDCNYVYVYCGFRAIGLAQGKLTENNVWEQFVSNVFVRCYGDDLLVGLSNRVRGWFNLTTLSKYLNDTWGMSLDTADKDGRIYKYKGLKDLKFISRSFVHVDLKDGISFYAGALKKEAISGLLHWTCSLSPIQMASQISDALYEAALHEESYYASILKSLRKAFQMVPQLTSMITPMSRDDMRRTIYLQNKRIAQTPAIGEGQLEDALLIIEKVNDLYSNDKLKQTRLRHFLNANDFINKMGQCIGKDIDYISKLNLAYQHNYITMPLYSQYTDHVLCTFTDCETHKVFVGKGFGETRKKEKAAAAEAAWDKWHAARIARAESDTAGPSIPSPSAIAAPSTTTGAENTNPGQLTHLPLQTPTAPSVANTGAGEIAGSGNGDASMMEIIELNPESQPLDNPNQSGRGFSIEEFLWNQWVPTSNGSITSAMKRGSIIATFSAKPVGISPLHNTYAELHRSAIFASEYLVVLIGAMNIAGTILVGWVPDISKTTYTIQELMATSWKILDVNGTKKIKVNVRDARKTGLYRELSESTNIPGIVMALLSPLNNMYSTAGTYQVSYEIFGRFGPQTMFFDPITEIKTPTSSSLYRDLGGRQFNLSVFGRQKFQLMMAGSSVPQWFDRNAESVSIPFGPAQGQGLHLSPANGILQAQEIREKETVLLFKSFHAGSNTSDSDHTQSMVMYLDGKPLQPIVPSGTTIVDASTCYTATSTKGHIMQQVFTEWTWAVDGLIENVDKGRKFYAPDFEVKDGKFTCEYGAEVFHPGMLLQDPNMNGTLSYALGLGIVYDQQQLGGRSRVVYFGVPGASVTTDNNVSWIPILTSVHINLAKYLDENMSTDVCLFELSTVSSLVCNIAYLRYTGFIVSYSGSNLISGTFDPNDVFVANFRNVDNISAVGNSDFSSWKSIVAGSEDLESVRRRIRDIDMRAESGIIASIIGGGMSGIGGAISKWQQQNFESEQNEKDRDLAWKQGSANRDLSWRTSQGSWQNILDNTNLNGSWNLMNTVAQGRNSLANIKASKEADLRNVTLTSAGAMNSTVSQNPRDNRRVDRRNIGVQVKPVVHSKATGKYNNTRTQSTQASTSQSSIGVGGDGVVGQRMSPTLSAGCKITSGARQSTNV